MAFTKYREWFALFINSICGFELTLRSQDLTRTDGWTAWNQNALLIAAIPSLH